MPDFKNEDEEKEVIRIGEPNPPVRYEPGLKLPGNSGFYTPELVLQRELTAANYEITRLRRALDKNIAIADAAEEQARELTIVNERINASYTASLAINDALHAQVRATKPTDDFKYMWIAVIVAGVFMGTIEIIQLIASLWQ